jgi:hypothetical protein
MTAPALSIYFSFHQIPMSARQELTPVSLELVSIGQVDIDATVREATKYS